MQVEVKCIDLFKVNAVGWLRYAEQQGGDRYITAQTRGIYFHFVRRSVKEKPEPKPELFP